MSKGQRRFLSLSYKEGWRGWHSFGCVPFGINGHSSLLDTFSFFSNYFVSSPNSSPLVQQRKGADEKKKRVAGSNYKLVSDQF